MSQGQPILLVEAEAIATELVALLSPACDRIEIAGSIRRRKPLVGDIEIVTVGRRTVVPGGDLWGEATSERDHLTERIAEMWGRSELSPRRVEIHRRDGTIEEGRRMGNAYRALEFRGLPVDLFNVPPPGDHEGPQWGVIFALRTGPGDWNTKLVTDCKRYFRRVEGGRVLHLGRPVPCPEERDFFRAIGQPWVEPANRQIAAVRIGPPG